MSEPRKSRREAKLTQRFKEYIGEESSSVKGQIPAKAAKALAKATPKTKDAPKSAVKVLPPSKATPTKKGPGKVVVAVKESPATAKAPIPAPKVPLKASPVASSPKAATFTVTQSVRKTSIKEVKKVAAAVRAKNEREPEVLRSKRVPKPSAKVAEAKETEAALSEPPVKKAVAKLTTATRVTTPTPPKVIKGIVSKTATLSPSGWGGLLPQARGRGVVLRGRGRGRGGGRGRGRGGDVHAAEEMQSEEDEKDEDDDDDDDDEVDEDEQFKNEEEGEEDNEDESMEVGGMEIDANELNEAMDEEEEDEGLDEEEVEEEEEEEEDDDEGMDEEQDELSTKLLNKVGGNVNAPCKKFQGISKSSNDILSSPSKSNLALKKTPASPSRQASPSAAAAAAAVRSPDTKTVMVSRAPPTGTPFNPIVKKVMVNSGTPVSIATQLQRKNNIADGTAVPPSDAVVRNSLPNKQQPSAASKMGGGGVKRIITTTATPDSPLAKKMKLAGDKGAGMSSLPSSSAATGVQGGAPATPASPVKTVPAPALKIVSPVMVTSSAVGRPTVVNRLAVVGRLPIVTPTNGVTPGMVAKSGLGRPPKLVKAGPASVKAAANKSTLSKAAGGTASSGSDNESTRRSRRQPKPTARMKEFLHRSSEEDEELGAEEAGLDPSLLEDEDDDEDLDFDSDDEEVSSKDNRRFLNMMKEASSTPKSFHKKVPMGNTRTMPLLSGPKSHVIKTQVVRKLGQTPVIVDKKVVPSQTSSKSTKLFVVKQDQSRQGSKGGLQKPDGINGDARKPGQMMGKPGLKITTAGGPRKETPIIIRVRTMDAEQLALKKKKQQEDDSKLGPRKVIIVDTQANKARKMRLDNLMARRDSMKDDSDSMHSEEESEIDDPLEEEEEPEDEEEQEVEEEEEDEVRPPQQKRPNVALSKKPLPDKCIRLLSLCKEAVDTLKQRQKAFKESDEIDKVIERRSLNKFLSLSEQIVEIIKQSIEEDPDSISDSDNFEEYCQDMLDSIAFKGDEDDLTTAEAERLEKWLRLKEGGLGAGASARDHSRSEQLKLYQQMLYLLTSVEHGARGEDLDEEEMGEEVEEEEDQDYSRDDPYGPYGPSEDEDDDLGEEEEEEDEDIDGPSAALDRR